MDSALVGILGLLKDGGPYVLAGVFAILWWGERSERRENTGLLLDLVPKMIAAMKDGTAAVDMLRIAMGGPEKRGGS